MARRSAGLTAPLARSSASPTLHEQIYRRIRDGVLKGTLPDGARVPSARGLAQELGVARGTVDLAYSRLVGEGFLIARGAAGTRVAAAVQRPPPLRSAVIHTHEADVEVKASQARLKPFAVGMPAVKEFPYTAWTHLCARELRRCRARDLAFGSFQGDAGLRDAIAAYLGLSRGVPCHRDQIWIGNGYQSILGLIARAMLEPGARIALEDPGYVRARLALAAAKLSVRPIGVDDEGIDVGALERERECDAVVVTPAHQMPLGHALSLPRRFALLEWARARKGWILEDDYDGEFHDEARPLPALKSLDASDRVFYAGTFSKTLFPALRVAYVVVPEWARRRVREVASLLQPAGWSLPERALATFLRDGHFARHLRKMRSLYAERRRALLTALIGIDALSVSAVTGGLHVLAWLERDIDDRAVAALASKHGLAPGALSDYFIDPKNQAGPGLLLGFAALPKTRVAEAVRRLESVVLGV